MYRKQDLSYQVFLLIENYLVTVMIIGWVSTWSAYSSEIKLWNFYMSLPINIKMVQMNCFTFRSDFKTIEAQSTNGEPSFSGGKMYSDSFAKKLEFSDERWELPELFLGWKSRMSKMSSSSIVSWNKSGNIKMKN